MSEAREPDNDAFSWPVALGRAVIGFAQGVALWRLEAVSGNGNAVWAAAHPTMFSAILVTAAFAPFVPMGGLGRLRPLTLLAWTAVAFAVCAGLGAYDILRGVSDIADVTRYRPDAPVLLATVAFLFIGHHLIVPADAARKLIPPYPDYFDAAWKDAVQLILSGAFVGVFWLALALGAALFHLIGIDQVGRLIAKPWFALPVTGIALAAAVQLTDVRVGLIRGVRTVGLVLLSWLLPVATFIAVTFLAALPFTGLDPLFATKSATPILLAAAAGLIILINAAYQDGAEARVPAFLGWTAIVAAVALLPLAGIAAFALSLRIGQYGFTPERVIATVCVLVAAGYALGYGVAVALSRKAWLKLIERVNIAMAVAILAAILALFTPLADPARISVDSQVARLTGGLIAPDRFDYDFLRFQSGRFGRDALARLAAQRGSARDADIATRAAIAQKRQYPERAATDEGPVRPLEDRLKVYPAGATLPPAFLDLLRTRTLPDLYWCDDAGVPCEADVVDVDGDGTVEVVIFQPFIAPSSAAATPGNLYIYRLDTDGQWTSAARFGGSCEPLVEALRSGRPTIKTGGPEIEAGGRRFDLTSRDTCQSRPAP